MKHRFIRSAAAACFSPCMFCCILVSLFASCSGIISGPTENKAKPKTGSLASDRTLFIYNAVPQNGQDRMISEGYAEGVNAFAVDLLSLIASDREYPGTNLLISPFSASRCLALVSEGASDQAKAQILDVLGGPEAVSGAASALGELLCADDSVVFNSADAVFFKNSLALAEGFADGAKTRFGAWVEGLDFGNPTAAAGVMNEWIETNTGGYIKDYIVPDSITSDTLAFIANAVFFKADWASPFDCTQTKRQPFLLSDGTPVDADMMRSEYRHLVREGEGYRNALIFYGTNKADYFFMDLYLPDQDVSIEDFIKTDLDAALRETVARRDSFASDDGRAEDGAAPGSYAYGILEMPKLSYEADTVLTEYLKTLGMTRVFNAEGNPLSRMFADQGAFLSGVRHRAGLIADEAGTVAYAVTVAQVDGTAGPGDETLTLDRPYVFCIRAGQTGMVLFAGAVMNPSRDD